MPRATNNGGPREGVGASATDQALAALRSATIALIVAAEKDSVADFPVGVDYSFLDDAWAALDATYPSIWTNEQVANLEAWQDAGWAHPLTCVNRGTDWHQNEDGEEVTLAVTSTGLVCRCCGYRQFQVPEVCFQGPGRPPSPHHQEA